jgi:putative aldouronate transport system substrate-binding protein
MNKKIGKVLSVILVVGLLYAGFTGCTDKNSAAPQKNTIKPNQQQSADPKEKDPYAPVEGKKYKISWTAYQKAPTDPDGEMIRYYEDMFNVDIDVWNLEYDKYEKMLDLRLAAGEIPDLFRIQNPDSLPKYAAQGVLAELPMEVFEKYAPNILKVTEDNAPGFFNYGKVNGKLYAMPSVSQTNIFRLPIVYRKDWMENVGVTKVPETLEEFEALMYKFAKEDPDGNGKDDTYGLSQDGMSVVFGAFGGVPQRDYWVEKDGKPVYTGTMPEMKQALALLHKWYKDGILDPEFITGENYGGYWAISHSFINGRVGMTARGNYYHWLKKGDYVIKDKNGNLIENEPGPIMQEMLSINPDVEIAFGQPPAGPGGIRGVMQYNRLMNFYGIGALAENEPGKVAKILQIMDYVSAHPDPTVRVTAMYGIEGKHWRWVDKEHEDFTLIGKWADDHTYVSRIGACIGMTAPFPLKAAREQWAYKNGFDKYGIESIIQVATPTMSKYKSKLEKIREEAYIAIITGDKPIDYFDEFVERYNAAGGTEVEREINEWYQTHRQ